MLTKSCFPLLPKPTTSKDVADDQWASYMKHNLEILLEEVPKVFQESISEIMSGFEKYTK